MGRETRDRVRTRTARVEVDVARGLEALPAIAAAAEAGELSFDQLEHLVVLATPATDAEWAKRGRTAGRTRSWSSAGASGRRTRRPSRVDRRRVPGCERSFGLDAHHLVPRSQGGGTDKHNVCLICTRHHRIAVPHGPWILAGDPELPDGFNWRRIGETDVGARARDGPAA